MDIKYINSKLKRFLLFQYDQHYPSGGLRDCLDFDTLDEIWEQLKKGSKYDTIEVFDCKEQKEVDITKYGFKY